MPIPRETQQLIEQALTMVRKDPGHHLSPAIRFEIYKSFGNSNHTNNLSSIKEVRKGEDVFLKLSLADKTLGFLSILTARKVLPIWLDNEAAQFIDNDEEYSNDPVEMLKIAENVINNTLKPSRAYVDLCSRFYNGLLSLEYTVNEKIYCVALAAYSSLEVTLCGIEGLRFSSHKKVNYTDEEVTYGQRDFAAFATRAYISIDTGEAGNWRFKNRNSEKYVPLVFDPQKRLEFWEWWLTQAIPQAWELAEGVLT